MLLKWKADNQLENWYSDLFVQYSQLVNRLAVYTEVFDNTTVMSANFSTFNASTQQWEELDESTIALVGYRQDDTRNGYIFSATMPVSVMMQDGVVGLSISAQTPTGYTDGNGDTVYQTQTSGIFKIFINKSLNNGTVPVPDNLNAIIQAIQNIDRNVIYADKFTANATTVSSENPARATVTKDAETGITNIAFDIPAGAKWHAGTQITGTGDNIEVAYINGVYQIGEARKGDYFLNTNTGNVYVCKVDTDISTAISVWSYVGNIKGAKGDAGTFAISKVYSSVDAMNAGFATDGLPIGALVVIETGNVDNPDNAKLYVKEENGYQFLTDMSGAKGIQGPQGNGIVNIQQTTNNTGSGEANTVVMTLDNGASRSFTVYNGQAGTNGTKIFVGAFDNPNEHPQVVEGAVVGDLYIGRDGGLWDYTGQTTGWFKDAELKGMRGKQGEEGVGITNIQKVASVGLRDEYRISLSSGNTYTFNVTNGKDGTDGTNGTNGVSVVSITKTATNGLVDTYTITLSNGTTSNFDVTNGKDGTNGTNGQPGLPGANGVSIIGATITEV